MPQLAPPVAQVGSNGPKRHLRVAPSLKAALRKKLRSARRSFSPSDHQRRSAHAVRVLTRLPGFKSGNRVAVYLPFDGEVDTAALLSAARRRGIVLYTPVIIDKRRGHMRFHRLDGELVRGHFGISVPRRLGPALSARWLHLIVVPLVGIDARGYRLGMGRGFYDRALVYRRSFAHLGPRLVGLAFECQRTDDCHAEAWDIRLDMLATENGLQRFTIRSPKDA